MQVLSVALCERRLLFIGDSLTTISSTVLSMVAVLHPFKWVHNMIPILPMKRIETITSPAPYIIGMKKSFALRQIMNSLDGVVIVDVDSGDCTKMGEVSSAMYYCQHVMSTVLLSCHHINSLISCSIVRHQGLCG